jgi:PAS domain-containing protein
VPAPETTAAPDPAPVPADGTEPLGVAVVSAEGSILFTEPRVASAIGRTVDELTAMPIEQLIHPNDLGDWRKLAAGDPGPADVRYMHPSGHPIFLRITARHVETGGGDAGALVASFFARSEAGTASSGAYVVMTDWG